MIYRNFNNKSRVIFAIPRVDGNYAIFTLGTIEFESGYLECYRDIKNQTHTITDKLGKPYTYYDEMPDKIKHELFEIIFERHWNI